MAGALAPSRPEPFQGLGSQARRRSVRRRAARRRRTGELAQLDAGKELLADFGDEWWSLHAEPNLARSTLELYAMLWDTHILPRLGSVALRELTPEMVNRFRLQLEADGVGRVSVRKALTLLHGVLQRACEWGRIPSNPVAAVRKPPAGRARVITPLTPDIVEHMRDQLLGEGLVRDATLISVLAYAGLRPGEALALTWAHVRERTLLIEAAVSIGAISETKTRRRRTVRLLAPLAQDLAEWREHARGPAEDVLVFPGRGGEPWSRAAYQNWRRRIYAPTAARAGAHESRPYDLRHSFVSLLIAEGHNIVDVARQAGHSPKMALDTYAHVFEEFDPTERIDAADRIQKAREERREAARDLTLFDVG